MHCQTAKKRLFMQSKHSTASANCKIVRVCIMHDIRGSSCNVKLQRKTLFMQSRHSSAGAECNNAHVCIMHKRRPSHALPNCTQKHTFDAVQNQHCTPANANCNNVCVCTMHKTRGNSRMAKVLPRVVHAKIGHSTAHQQLWDAAMSRHP